MQLPQVWLVIRLLTRFVFESAHFEFETVLIAKLNLTGAEFKMLELLNQSLGNIINKEVLCEQALGRKLTRYDRSVDVHVSNLRKKLVDAGATTDIIVNQRGTGYLLKPE